MAVALAAGAGVGPAAGDGLGCGVGPVVPLGKEESEGREERNASDPPSGLQRGDVEDCGLVVNCHGARLPSVDAIQMDEFLRF